MEHWQVLKLMVAGLWSEIAQDKISQIKNGLVFEKEKISPQWGPVLFLLAAGGATKERAFLLSEVELMRIGSIVAYLDIS
jgi:hypothetical protein